MPERKQDFYLRELKVEAMYYYEGTIAVCLLVCEDYSVRARGVAICSLLDQFNKRVGRAKALGMALKAAIRQTDSFHIEPIRFRADHPIHNAWACYHYRSVYRPRLLMKETMILVKMREVKERKEAKVGERSSH